MNCTKCNLEIIGDICPNCEIKYSESNLDELRESLNNMVNQVVDLVNHEGEEQ